MTDQHSHSDEAQCDTRDAAVAAALDMDIETDDGTGPELDTLLAQLSDRDVDPVVAALLKSLVQERDRLAERVDELEDNVERTHDIATTASGDAAANESRLDDLDEDHDETREIARSAVAKAQQLEADTDQQEDAESLPEGVEPSSSPLDFFANCREQTVKEVFVERSNRQNTYRAVKVAKRWPEFGTERVDGSGVFFTKDDLRTALTAELGKEPHGQTVKRVWQKLQELGGEDVRVKTRQVGRRQESTEIVAMSMETAEALLEKRYLGLDLLDGDAAATGGVTPVVTAADGARV
ncbi:hypothetical protein NDI56_21060 [Haloarcula sp. S1CR25-12]|uniref:Uncharacterized protein n=1 Tax=Haloarcula saliterrae TaxID=2950534 RepID=A0ABU2FI12_9EURY|nr:hypothetical protein [Haloarcula sp. S1CR25-12]MDS0261899.1 hypothetical protein [Haloarcula sp. S1CR25-12]